MVTLMFLFLSQVWGNLVFEIEQTGNELFTGNPKFHVSIHDASEEDFPISLYQQVVSNGTSKEPSFAGNITTTDTEVTLNVENLGPNVTFYIENELHERSESSDVIQLVATLEPFYVDLTYCDIDFNNLTCDGLLEVTWFTFASINTTIIKLPFSISGFYLQPYCSENFEPQAPCGEPHIITETTLDGFYGGKVLYDGLTNGQPYQIAVLPLFVDLSLTWSGVPGFSGVQIPGAPNVGQFSDLELVVYLKDDDLTRVPIELSPDFHPNITLYSADIDVLPRSIMINATLPDNCPRSRVIVCFAQDQDCWYDISGEPHIVDSELFPQMNMSATALSEDKTKNTTYQIMFIINAPFTEEPSFTNPPQIGSDDSALSIVYVLLPIIFGLIVIFCVLKWFDKRKKVNNQLKMSLLRNDSYEGSDTLR